MEKNHKISIDCRKEDFHEIFSLIYNETFKAIRVYFEPTKDVYSLYFCDKFTRNDVIRDIFKSLEKNGYKLSKDIVDILVEMDFDEYIAVFVEKA